MYLKHYEIFVCVIMCLNVFTQLIFFPCGPEMPKGWTRLLPKLPKIHAGQTHFFERIGAERCQRQELNLTDGYNRIDLMY